MKSLLKSLNKKGIIYYPFLAEVTGSIKSAVLLSQIIYWWEACGKRPFYKTNDEFCQEIGMNINEFKAAKIALQNLTFVKMYIEGLPARSYYDIDLQLAENQLTGWLNVSPSSGLESANILYTKNTKDITSSSVEEDKPSQKESNDSLEKLPTWMGNTALKRLIKVYSILWKEKYGFNPTITKWGQLGKQFKLLISTFTEYQISAIIVLHFDWKGASGTDEFTHKRLAEKCFPLEYVPKAVNEYRAFLQNSVGLDFEDRQAVRGYVIKILKPLIKK